MEEIIADVSSVTEYIKSRIMEAFPKNLREAKQREQIVWVLINGNLELLKLLYQYRIWNGFSWEVDENDIIKIATGNCAQDITMFIEDNYEISLTDNPAVSSAIYRCIRENNLTLAGKIVDIFNILLCDLKPVKSMFHDIISTNNYELLSNASEFGLLERLDWGDYLDIFHDHQTQPSEHIIGEIIGKVIEIRKSFIDQQQVWQLLKIIKKYPIHILKQFIETDINIYNISTNKMNKWDIKDHIIQLMIDAFYGQRCDIIEYLETIKLDGKLHDCNGNINELIGCMLERKNENALKWILKNIEIKEISGKVCQHIIKFLYQ